MLTALKHKPLYSIGYFLAFVKDIPRLFANMLDKNENVVNWNVISHNLCNIGWTQHVWVKNVNTR